MVIEIITPAVQPACVGRAERKSKREGARGEERSEEEREREMSEEREECRTPPQQQQQQRWSAERNTNARGRTGEHEEQDTPEEEDVAPLHRVDVVRKMSRRIRDKLPAAGWVSVLLLDWLRNAVQPPGSRTASI